MVSLQKGQRVILTKTSGTGDLKNIRMALGWDAIQKKTMFGKSKETAVDLDASAILFDRNRQEKETVYFGRLTSKNGSLKHTGDNLTGAGDGDDESILVKLDQVPSDVKSIVFVVNSYSGQTFDQIENAYCRAVDSDASDVELCKYELSGGEKVQAMVMAALTRTDDHWAFSAIGTPVVKGSRLKDVIPAAQNALTSI